MKNFHSQKKYSKCNSRIHCLHKTKAGDVPNGCGRYFMYEKKTMLTVWKLLNRLFMSKFVKILFPVENQYFDKILERLTANP